MTCRHEFIWFLLKSSPDLKTRRVFGISPVYQTPTLSLILACGFASANNPGATDSASKNLRAMYKNVFRQPNSKRFHGTLVSLYADKKCVCRMILLVLRIVRSWHISKYELTFQCRKMTLKRTMNVDRFSHGEHVSMAARACT